MSRPCRALPWLLVLALGPAVAQAQSSDAAAKYLTPDFTYDAARSKDAQKTVEFATSMITRGMVTGQSRTWVFRHSGSLEEAFGAIKVPDTAKVQKPERTDYAASLKFATELFAEQARAAFGQGWLDRARARAAELGPVEAMRFLIYPEGDLETLTDGAPPGGTVRLVYIDGTNPMFEFASLEVVPGTWVRVVETTLTLPAGGATSDAAGPTAADLGMPPPAGGIWLDPDDVPPMDELHGDHHFLVRAPMRQVVDAYLASRERHCRIESEGAMAGPDDSEVPMVDLQCLTHPGELRNGDDVVALTVTAPSEDLLLEAAPSTQGTWTLVIVSRWKEEQ